MSDSSIYWPENGHWPIFNLKSDEDEKADEDKKLEQAKADKAAESMRFKKAAKIIAGLESKKHIKIKLIHQLMLDETDYAISRYMQKESIPSHYSKIVKSHIPDGLQLGREVELGQKELPEQDVGDQQHREVHQKDGV